MDDHDPTLNNPALDLEDSDDDAEWNPLKDAEKSGKRKRGGDSSDEEDYSEFNNIHQLNKNKNKRRAYQQANSSHSIQNRKSTADTPEVPEEEDFKVSYIELLLPTMTSPCQVGTFLVLKTEESSPRPSLWRVDGRTLIQKYESCEEDGQGRARLYKCVNTFSGWTANTRSRYAQVRVRQVKSKEGESLVERIREQAPDSQAKAEADRKDPATSTRKKINLE